ISGESLERRLGVQRDLLEIIKTENDPKAAEAKMRDVISRLKDSLPEAQKKEFDDLSSMIDAQLKALRSPWFRFFLSYDPRPTLSKVRGPVRALLAENDLQVPPRENLAPIEETLKKAGTPDVTAREVPGVNHLFQTSRTGSPAEYATIEETIAPKALETVVGW